jgi:beta-RFAP synthase
VRGAHGDTEVRAFRSLAKIAPDDRATEALCRLALLGMLPAILQLDLDSFGEAVYDFNRRAGEMFRSVQGGLYATPRVEQLVAAIRGFGIKSVGQSSWGPTVFAIALEQDLIRLREFMETSNLASSEEMILTQPRNCGAEVNTVEK